MIPKGTIVKLFIAIFTALLGVSEAIASLLDKREK